MISLTVANRQCIKRSGNTRRLGQTPIDPVLEEPGLQLIQMTSVWSKYLTWGVKSQPKTLSRSRNWLLAKTFRSRRSGTKLSSFTKSMKTDDISNYLNISSGYLFISNLFFVIGVLMILVIFGLQAACTRGCIAKWRLYSSRPSPGSKGSGYGWINRVHDWTVRRHWRRVVFPNEFKIFNQVHILYSTLVPS